VRGGVALGGMNANVHKTIAWVATGIFILFSIVGDGPSTYRYAFLFLGPLLWGVYFCRKLLALSPVHFAVLAAAFLVHNLGAFGTYGKFYGGLEFDTYVHFFFGFAGGLIVARGLLCNLGFTGWKLWVGTVLLILGIGAIHELVEYVSTLMLGGEKGMLKTNDPDKFDTQKDLANNLLGTLLGLVLEGLFGQRRARTPPSEAHVGTVESKSQKKLGSERKHPR
jgi:uncharacterized membrane protein YjdF